MSTVICKRKLVLEKQRDRHVVVSLDIPEQSGPEEWRCVFRIEGLGKMIEKCAHGIDSFQSLCLALDGIRMVLKKSGQCLTWTGGENGDHGFRLVVPSFFGLSFARAIEKQIDILTTERGESLVHHGIYIEWVPGKH